MNTPMDFETEMNNRRSDLALKSQALQHKIAEEIDDTTLQAKELGKKLLVIGGVFVATYVVLSLFFGGDEESDSKEKIIVIQQGEKEGTHGLPASMGGREVQGVYQSIINHIATFVLAIAKEKLLDLLDQMNKEGQSTAE